MTLRFNVFASTHTGRVRARNEDHLLVGPWVRNQGWLGLSCDADDDFIRDYGLLLAVADGMGGENGGAMASRLTLVTLDREFHRTMKRPEAEDFRSRLVEAVASANRAVVHGAEVDPALTNMGTTLSGVCLTPYSHLLFHCGDSRVYRSRNGMLKLLTVDDTVAERNARLGFDALPTDRTDPEGHLLTNCIGRDYSSCHIEWVRLLEVGDRLLVCSDGLHGFVAEDVIAERLASEQSSAEQIGVALVEEAMDAGGADNVSVLVIDVAGSAC